MNPERSIPRLLTRAIALPSIVMALLAVTLVVEVRALLSLMRWVDQTDRVIAEANLVQRLLVEQQAGLRGFVLTRAPGVLVPYRSSQLKLPVRLRNLSQAVADNPNQQDILREVTALADRWKDVAADALRIAEGGDSEGAARALSSGVEAVWMDRMRGLLSDFIRSEEVLREARVERARRGARNLVAGSLGLVALLGLVLVVSGRKQILELARRFREALRHEAEAAQVREEFLNLAAHELRTPLTSLQLQLQRLRRDREVLGPAAAGRQSEQISVALRQTRRLTQLIETILDAMTFTSGAPIPLELSQIDLAEVARAAAQRFEAPERRLGCALEVRVAEGVAGTCDRRRLAQALDILLENACKYGEGKPVALELGAEGDAARLVVRDQGIGLDAGAQQRIFHRFGRAAPARSYPGLGLGLYAARRIVEAHGGSLTVSSEKGKGSAFAIELPRGRRSQAAA